MIDFNFRRTYPLATAKTQIYLKSQREVNDLRDSTSVQNVTEFQTINAMKNAKGLLDLFSIYSVQC